jgi:hypothetical protein
VHLAQALLHVPTGVAARVEALLEASVLAPERVAIEAERLIDGLDELLEGDKGFQ